jgi:HTH-type transcriptional regulator/antitoxin HigA
MNLYLSSAVVTMWTQVFPVTQMSQHGLDAMIHKAAPEAPQTAAMPARLAGSLGSSSLERMPGTTKSMWRLSMNMKPIRTDDDLRAAFQRLELVFQAQAGTPEEDEMEILVTLIEAYEHKHFPIGPADPVEAINQTLARRIAHPLRKPSGLGIAMHGGFQAAKFDPRPSGFGVAASRHERQLADKLGSIGFCSCYAIDSCLRLCSEG